MSLITCTRTKTTIKKNKRMRPISRSVSDMAHFFLISIFIKLKIPCFYSEWYVFAEFLTTVVGCQWIPI